MLPVTPDVNEQLSLNVKAVIVGEEEVVFIVAVLLTVPFVHERPDIVSSVVLPFLITRLFVHKRNTGRKADYT